MFNTSNIHKAIDHRVLLLGDVAVAVENHMSKWQTRVDNVPVPDAIKEIVRGDFSLEVEEEKLKNGRPVVKIEACSGRRFYVYFNAAFNEYGLFENGWKHPYDYCLAAWKLETLELADAAREFGEKGMPWPDPVEVAEE